MNKVKTVFRKILDMRPIPWLSGLQDTNNESPYFPREAREEVVTVLFLDIIGFSAASLSRTPAEAFRDLKTMFDRITRLVHSHGGTVDRTLGDGLLAYFTSNDSPDIYGSHADRAIACAIAIHRAQIEETLSGVALDRRSILPMRIGINSGSVYMGDLGNEERRDFTIIGTAVNLGQRLETACEINRIMIGERTLELAEQYNLESAGMRRRPILAKSYLEPILAFEFDPFFEDSESNRKFIKAFRSFAQKDRTEERYSCEEASLFMVTNRGHATVLNVSRSGVMLRFSQYIAKTDVIYVSQVIAKIEHINTPPLVLEVRWGNPDEMESYTHGCLLKNLNEEQKSELWDLWESILNRSNYSGPQREEFENL